MKQRDDHMTRCVPLSLHGDGVPISGQGRTYARNVYCFTLSSYIGKGQTLDAIFLIWMCYKQWEYKHPRDGTMQHFFGSCNGVSFGFGRADGPLMVHLVMYLVVEMQVTD